MIEKISGIKICGRCFKSETNLILYPTQERRIAIVYGKNGSGKSTISEGVALTKEHSSGADIAASFIDINKHEIAIQDSTCIHVFNEKYIDDNVKIDDDGLGTIVLLGTQVSLQSQIDTQEKKVELLSKDVEKANSEYSKYDEKNSPLSPNYHQQRIINTLKQDGGWAEEDSHIKGKKIKSSVTPAIIKEIGDLVVNQTIEELQNQKEEKIDLLNKISDNSTTFPKKIELIDYNPNLETNILNLLATKVEKPELSQREKLIFNTINSGHQTRVESARKGFSQEDVTFCPYCYQPVTDQYKHELIESINRVLNKEVDEHKAQLNSIQFPYIAFDFDYINSLEPNVGNTLFQHWQKLKDLINEYQELISKKTENIFTPIITEPKGISNIIQEINNLLDSLEQKRIVFNDAVNKKEELVKELLLLNKSIVHIQTEQLYRDYRKQEKEKALLQNNLDKKEKELSIEKEKLNELLQQKSNIRLAIDRINSLLDYVFFSHGRLSISLHNDKYYLKSNGDDVQPKNVSQGERNIIALCYFFTQILSNQEIDKAFQNESFVIIDDPISSFDFENKIGIISLLRYQADSIISGNYSSKILFLSHDIETVFHLRKAMDEICNTYKGIAGFPKTSSVCLELRNKELIQFTKKHNEYGSLLQRVYHFANGDSGDDSLIIGNEMRRVLEAFSTFSYQKSIEQVSCDPNVIKALGDYSIFYKNLMYRLVLHGESHYEEQINSIHDGNNFYQFISEAEKVKTAKHILCLIYILNPYHIRSYLSVIPGAVNTIQQWVNAIPKNESFSMVEKQKTRTIPLYNLPLSAGLGNESFDGFPSDNYETDHQSCDFALKVSGDSMEPKIPDGSIVLIKKQNTIDDHKAGAFYYNGKVYCKYLKHESGKVFLCSYNEDYSPIVISGEDKLVVYGEVVQVI